MSDNEEIIDVLVAVDADTIVSKYGTNTDPNSPVQITDPTLIFMITKQADAVNGNAGNELTIGAKTLDTIRWRETTLSLNAAYFALLYKFEAGAGGNLISPPIPLEADVETPLPDPANPTVPKKQTIKSFFWNSTVLEPGSVTYHFNFMILDRNGDVQGYYWWDPFIKITD
ncbi:MAG: inclusion body family protein [Anaerolineaceae bacterium]|nr:inclusion body family protein [Anaerolineaceae bacterium]